MMSEEDDFQVKNLDGYSKKNFFYYTNKRIFDVLGGLIGLTISAIPIAIFAVIIKKRWWPGFLYPKANWSAWQIFFDV